MTLDSQYQKYMGSPFMWGAEHVHVTIDTRGAVFLNERAHYLMGRPPAVILYFNEPKNTIVLEPAAAAQGPNAFPVSPIHDKGRKIYASGFCRHFGIRPEATLRFIEPAIDDEYRMHLNLHETITVSRRQRGK